MRKVALSLIATLCFMCIACSPVENQARDTAAALGGLLAQVQTQDKATCTVNPSQSICQTINKAISAQNALITSTEAYCGWSTTSPPGDPTASCVPVKSLEGALQTSIANANTFVTQLKGAIQ